MTAISPGATPLYGSRGRHNGLTEKPASQPACLSRPAGQVQRLPSSSARLRALAGSRLPGQHLARPHLEPRGVGTPPKILLFLPTHYSQPAVALAWIGFPYSADGCRACLPYLHTCAACPPPRAGQRATLPGLGLVFSASISAFARPVRTVAAGFEADPVLGARQGKRAVRPSIVALPFRSNWPSIGCYGGSASFPCRDNKLRSHIAPCNEAHHIGAPWRTQDGSPGVNLSLAPSTHCGVVYRALPSKPLTRKAWATLNGVR